MILLFFGVGFHFSVCSHANSLIFFPLQIPLSTSWNVWIDFSNLNLKNLLPLWWLQDSFSHRVRWKFNLSFVWKMKPSHVLLYLLDEFYTVISFRSLSPVEFIVGELFLPYLVNVLGIVNFCLRTAEWSLRDLLLEILTLCPTIIFNIWHI